MSGDASAPPYAEEEVTFFKGITANPLAKAVFRGGVVCGTLEGTPTDKFKHWRSAVSVVISIFKVYHLEAAVPTASKWVASNLGSSPTEVPQQQVGINRYVKFCCQRCKERGIYSLLGVGQCVLNDEGQFVIDMQKVFFHDKDCVIEKEEKLPSFEFMVFDFEFDEVIGDTYDLVVQRFKGCDFHDKDIPTLLPGHSINYGTTSYDFDDRVYEYLPSSRYPDINKGEYRCSMLRVLFMMAADLNMASEVAYTVLDMKKFIFEFTTPNQYCHCTEEINPEQHLYFNEVSLLFGGHSMLKDEEDSDYVVDQIVHKDGETSEGEIKNIVELMGRHKPGSFIIPLDEPRTIFVCTPQLLVTAKKGQYIWFHGALAHGGKTYKASKEGNDWKPAIHGHLDSNYHKRKRGDFAFEGSDNVYFPLEHVQFMNDLSPILSKARDTNFNVMSEISKRALDDKTGAEYQESLSQSQVFMYNSNLCCQDLDLDLLPIPMSTPVLLKLINDTSTRLEQLMLSNAVDKKPVTQGPTHQVAKEKKELQKAKVELQKAKDDYRKCSSRKRKDKTR